MYHDRLYHVTLISSPVFRYVEYPELLCKNSHERLADLTLALHRSAPPGYHIMVVLVLRSSHPIWTSHMVIWGVYASIDTAYNPMLNIPRARQSQVVFQ